MVEGVLLIDKPKGPSSFDIVRKLRGMAKIKRIGHAGTLDPLASGLLVVCLGRYTKLASVLTDDDKVYEAVFCLGTTTSSDDGEGEIVKTVPFDHLTSDEITAAIKTFSGRFLQTPPKFSAVRINGVRAYKMARANQEVEIAPREIEVFSLEVTNISLPHVTVRIHCSKGTYVRSLARDIGNALGVGAYAQEIRRIRSGGFDVSKAISFHDLSRDDLPQRLLTGVAAISHLETIAISESDRDHVSHGRTIALPSSLNRSFGILVCNADAIAIVKHYEGQVQLARVL